MICAAGFRGAYEVVFFFLSECTPLERCCVHNKSPFISSSGLSPGSREAKVQRAKVCLNCTEPSVATSFCWSLPVGWYLLGTHCNLCHCLTTHLSASDLLTTTACYKSTYLLTVRVHLVHRTNDGLGMFHSHEG